MQVGHKVRKTREKSDKHNKVKEKTTTKPSTNQQTEQYELQTIKYSSETRK